MRWFRSLKSRLNRKDAPPSLTVAAFGKHPVYPDHIESGIGEMTEPISAFKQRLYNRGIKHLVDCGAWADKPEDRLLAEFDHQFLSLSGSEMLIGMFWSSRDARGRSAFPFVLVTEAQGVPLEWALRTCAPVMASLRASMASCESEAAMHEACTQAQAELTVALESLAAHQDALPRLAPRLSEIVERLFTTGAYGDGNIGLLRALHRVDDASRPRAKGVSAPSLHMRLPRDGGDALAQLADWSVLLLDTVGLADAVVGVAPREGDWIDLLAGPPRSEEFYMLRATPADTPLDTEIPYELPSDLEARWRGMTSGPEPEEVG